MTKRSVGLFLTSSVITALIILLIISLIMTEHNTLRLGFGQNAQILSLHIDGIVINGTEYSAPFEKVLNFLKNDIFKVLVSVFLFL